MQRMLLSFLMAALCVACSKKQETAVTTTGSSTTATTTGTIAHRAEDLVGLASGALVAVTGCYSHGLAPLVGRMEGRLLKYSYKMPNDDSGPAIAIFSNDGTFKITVEGYTDATSTPQHNQELSESRANAVKAYLAGAGVDAGRLTAAGFGATKPVVSNDSALGRAENRRVELAKS